MRFTYISEKLLLIYGVDPVDGPVGKREKVSSWIRSAATDIMKDRRSFIL